MVLLSQAVSYDKIDYTRRYVGPLEVQQLIIAVYRLKTRRQARLLAELSKEIAVISVKRTVHKSVGEAWYRKLRHSLWSIVDADSLKPDEVDFDDPREIGVYPD